MKGIWALIGVSLFVVSLSAVAQQSSSPDAAGADNPNRDAITVRGCLRSQLGNYILIENRTGTIYALQGVGNNLQSFLRKEVEVRAENKPGSIKIGIRPEKAGSNPSDTVHRVDGVPLQVKNIEKDIRITAKHCKAADQQ